MTIHPSLQAQLELLARRRSRSELWIALAITWFIGAVLGAGLINLHYRRGLPAAVVIGISILVPLVASAWLLIRFRFRPIDYRALALSVEKTYPALQGRLLTAIQQQPDSDGRLNVLQQRVLDETLAAQTHQPWAEVFPGWRLRLAQTAAVCAFVLFGVVCLQLHFAGNARPRILSLGDLSVSVMPGDVTLERGSSLVVMARFLSLLPPKVDLVVSPALEGRDKIPLVKSLADPMFGLTIPEVNSNLTYYLEFGGKRTPDFKVTVFDYPRLERADADVVFPDYTQLPSRHIPDTKRLSAVEGSRAHLRLQFNKQLSRATLVPLGTNAPAVPLALETNQPAADLNDFVLQTSRSFGLQLVDLEGRTNKVPAHFVFDVLPNRTPELKIASPPGDTRPSALEEVSFAGTVWDDFGVKEYGLTYAVAGQPARTYELGTNVPGKERRPFTFLMRGEELRLKPDDLVTWFLWADDLGPDGKVRRTTGDLYFAEVRPFEEIFREGQSMSGEAAQQRGGGNQGPAAQASEMQKQIINATWNLLRRQKTGTIPGQSTPPGTNSSGSERTSSLSRELQWRLASVQAQTHRFFGQQRDENSVDGPPTRGGRVRPASSRRGDRPAPTLKEDLNVVIEAQEQVLERAQSAKGRQQDPTAAALWDAAATQLQRALDQLHAAASSPGELQAALEAEQAACHALLKLQEREFSVTRSRNRQSGQGGREQMMRRQLDQLDLSRTEDRYETERQAQAPQSAERSEQLQVMSRLQELARRQQDINQQLKDLQTALQQARTDQEREEIRRRLKRLQEDEQQVLADADELRQRMERPENQSRMSEERRQVDQARNDLQRAAEAAQQGLASQALASGTRAQQQLQSAREDLRRQSASEFDQELRDLRNDARELARRQEQIQQQMDNTNDPHRRTLGSGEPNQESLQQLAQQRDRLTNLVGRATELSQQAEQAEPLMSRELYDTLRRFSQSDAGTLKQFQEELINRGQASRDLYERLKKMEESSSKSIDLTSEFLKEGLGSEAALAQERARAGIDDLKKGVERAAGSVLGDEAQALRRARDELERVADQLAREIAQNEGGNTTNVTIGSGRGEQGQTNNVSAQEAAASGGATPGGTNQASLGQRAGQEANPTNQRGGELANNQPQENEPDREGRQPGGRSGENQQQTGEGGTRNRTGSQAGGQRGGLRPLDMEHFLEGRGGYAGGPITGQDFAPWSDSLREIEELIDAPALRSDVARARERARQLRQGFRRAGQKPDWAQVRLEILKPLVEVRDQVAEQLARLGPREDLVPIDRDPVPPRYSDLVRRYYEELGKDNRLRVQSSEGAHR